MNQVIHTSRGTAYSRRRHACQSREYLRSIAPCMVGANNPHAKLTEETAMAIYNEPGKLAVVALMFGVSPQQVSKIRHKVLWKHIHE